MSQLSELARKFPESLIKQKPGKFAASYVEHGVIVQRLLETVGPYNWSIVKVITNADGIAVGCIAQLQVDIDGRTVVIEEIGDCERPSDNSASNLKASSSDALKRCAMRVGLGLHLWTGEAYYLDRALGKPDAA